MMELKEEGKVRGNMSSERGGAVEMHVMERKPAWSQCTHLSVCKTAQAHILRYVFKDVVTVKSVVKLWCWCQTLCSMIVTWRHIKGVFTPFCLFSLVPFGWWVGGLGLLPACVISHCQNLHLLVTAAIIWAIHKTKIIEQNGTFESTLRWCFKNGMLLYIVQRSRAALSQHWKKQKHIWSAYHNILTPNNVQRGKLRGLVSFNSAQ